MADIFTNHGYELRVAGGAVRDLLLGKVPQDLDFATTATPEEMKTMFTAEGVRMINAGGEKHGTVTVRLDEENFECTTLRIDLVTDGRHAEVSFTKNWELDAGRRDLTINAMFLGLDGTVYDYFQGSQDLEERRITFVGEADTRIKEDYLRILRYFRFYGRIAKEPDSHHPYILECMKDNAHGLDRISGERIWVELQKIITGNFGGELLIKMVECGVGVHVGLPDTFNCGNVRAVYGRCQEAGLTPQDLHHMTLLASGFSSEEECVKLIVRIKCSKREQDILLHIVRHRDSAAQFVTVKDVQDHLVNLVIGEKRNKDIAMLYTTQLLKYCCHMQFLKEIQEWEVPKFPVNGSHILERGVPRKKIKFALQDLLEEWKKSNFSLGTSELLETLDVDRYSN